MCVCVCVCVCVYIYIFLFAKMFLRYAFHFVSFFLVFASHNPSWLNSTRGLWSMQKCLGSQMGQGDGKRGRL